MTSNWRPGPREARESDSRFFHIVHFNDVYNLDSTYEEEPVGGARRFASALKQFKQELAHSNSMRPLVLFSGDFVGPSLMSSVTQGGHMIDALNAIGVDYATFGNHELDYGYQSLKDRLKGIDDDVYDGQFYSNYEASETVWLMTNISEVSSGLPLGGNQVARYALFDWGGEYGTTLPQGKALSGSIKVGLLAVSEDWLGGCSQLPSKTLAYEDYIDVARRTAQFLKSNGAEIVLALTHNRLKNDYELMDAVPEIDLLLGGHDHFYKEDLPRRIIKSGEEWRWMSKIKIELHKGNPKPIIKYERVDITSNFPENLMIDALCDKYAALAQNKFDRIIFNTAVDMDPTEESVRFKESTMANWVCDMCCEDYSLQDGLQSADICILLGFEFAGKSIIPAGDFKMRDVFTVFPRPCTLVVLKLSGQDIVKSLTLGAKALPGECGAIHHCSSSLHYTIVLPNAEGGVPSVKDVLFNGKPIDLLHMYSVAVTDGTAKGKFGFDWFKSAKRIVDEEFSPQLCDVILMYCKRHKGDSKFIAKPSMGRINII